MDDGGRHLSRRSVGNHIYCDFAHGRAVSPFWCSWYLQRDHTAEAEELPGMASGTLIGKSHFPSLPIPWSNPARWLQADPRNSVFAVEQQSEG